MHPSTMTVTAQSQSYDSLASTTCLRNQEGKITLRTFSTRLATWLEWLTRRGRFDPSNLNPAKFTRR